MDRFFKKNCVAADKYFYHFVVAMSFLLGLCLFSFSACSNGNIDIIGVQDTIVLEYSTEDSLPTMRLSAFVETQGDERRVEQVKLVHESSGMEWVCTSPRKISSNGVSVWAGYTNFVPATGEIIPQGLYSFYYIDMAGEESQTTFSISYPDMLLKTSANNLVSSFPGIEKAAALYDKDENLIYFGNWHENWGSNPDIKQDYGLAEKIRICYKLNSSSVVCMLPLQDL